MSNAANPPGPRTTLRCPAKINLHLRVGPVRADRFHPLLTWMTTVGLHDELTIETTPRPAGGPPVRLTCDDPVLPCDERNLVVRILHRWDDWATGHGGRAPAIDASLLKRVPAGAGLGGGSSDAATALAAVARLTRGLDREPTTEELSAVAARVGSDIPFFLYAPSAVCAGRGERVQRVAPPRANWAVLLLPGIHLSTAAVYGRFDRMSLGRTEAVEQEPDWQAWAELPAEPLLAKLVNDLEPAAFAERPDLDDLRRRAEAVASRPVRMSGSGSSLFTLFDARAEAERAEAALRSAGLAGTPDAGAARIVVTSLGDVE